MSDRDYNETRRSRIILTYLELVLNDLDNSLDESSSREEWKLRIKGLLIHWLGAVYDEGTGEKKDLETSLNITKKKNEVLSTLNKDLLERLSEIGDKGDDGAPSK